MPEKTLQGMKVAALVADGFEQIELFEPKKALEQAGTLVFIVSPNENWVQGMNHLDKADRVKVDLSLDRANPADFDALLLPGGVSNPDKLRTMEKVKAFVRAVDKAGKPIAVICHGPWTLVSAGLVKGRTITSYYTLQDDIRNAGGNWVDQEVVRDRNWVSSRNPQDLPAFIQSMIDLFAEYGSRRKAA